MVSDNFVDELASINDSLTKKENDTLVERLEEMRAWVEAISEDIDIATNAHLSKYATRIKSVALMAIKLCRKYEVYNDVDSVSYDAKRKMILLNEDDLYFLG